MKNLCTLLVLLIGFNMTSQNNSENVQVFVRIFDLDGVQFSKGKIASFSDTAVQLKSGGKTISIPITSIGKIKTKRSGANNVLIGATAGALIGGTVSVIDDRNRESGEWEIFSEGENALLGGVAGLISGAAVGGISILFKNSKTFIINGETEKFSSFTISISKKVE